MLRLEGGDGAAKHHSRRAAAQTRGVQRGVRVSRLGPLKPLVIRLSEIRPEYEWSGPGAAPGETYVIVRV